MRIKPLPGKVFVTNLERGQRVTKGGIVLRDDNAKEHGIRPRWAEVFAVSDEIKDIQPGEWILLEHGRWTFGFEITFSETHKETIWGVDYPNGVLLVSDEKPENI